MCAAKRKSPASKPETMTDSIIKKSKSASDNESEKIVSGCEASDKELIPSKNETESEEKEKVEKKDVKFPGFVKNDAGEYYMELCGNQRRITIRTFKGVTYVDIREFYEKDGKFLPGKKGISLTVEQWESIRDASKQIDSCIKNLKDA